jgi:hypothetical protein
MHPLCRSHTHALLEGGIKCAVTTETTLVSQLLDRYRLMASDSLMVETDEMLDAQSVDVDIISHALTGEMLTQIETVGSNNLSKLREGDVILQIESRLLAMLLQQ